MKKSLNYIKNVIKLLRVKHWIKNGLIFLPLFFSLTLTENDKLLKAILGFIAFSLAASVVYIINDIKDVEKDKLHSKKCKRPIAAGIIKIPTAILIGIVLMVISTSILVYLKSIWGAITLFVYLILNVLYSIKLKNIPIVDIVILASGFVLRVIFGGLIIKVQVSSWLLFTIIAAAFYMGMGKRRNEIMMEGNETRTVNKLYTKDFLDKNMYMSVTLALCFYAVWCITSPTITSFSNPGIIWTVPMIFVIFLRYNYLIERKDIDGDPINVFLKDIFLICLAIFFVIWVIVVIYIPIPLLHELGDLI